MSAQGAHKGVTLSINPREPRPADVKKERTTHNVYELAKLARPMQYPPGEDIINVLSRYIRVL